MTLEHSDKSRQQDTPRTNGAIGMWCKDGVAHEYLEPTIVDAGRFIEFARQLERELAEAARWKDMYWDRARAEREAAQSSIAAISTEELRAELQRRILAEPPKEIVNPPRGWTP